MGFRQIFRGRIKGDDGKMSGILYSDEEIKEMLIKEYPKLKETIDKNFDEIKEDMKQNEYFMDKIKDTIIDVFLEVITETEKDIPEVAEREGVDFDG
jgi:hypothetical protein